jgi:hypothetical protein
VSCWGRPGAGPQAAGDPPQRPGAHRRVDVTFTGMEVRTDGH